MKRLLPALLILTLINLHPVHYEFAFKRTAYAAEVAEGPIVCDGDQVEYLEAEKKVIGSGNVIITYKDAKLTCDKVTVWPETKEAEAEGNVRFTQGENILECERMRYNFENATGKIINMKGVFKPWYAKGKEAERVSEEEFRVSKGYITTCDHERPHWRLSADKVLIYPKKMVTTYNAVAWLNPFSMPWDIPVMWVPYYCHPLDDNRPHVTVIPGRSSEWGYYILTAWRYNLTPNQKGYIHVDYREKKDFASGIDYMYDSEIFGKGIATGYYMNERQLSRKHTWHSWSKEDKSDPTIEEEKGLLRVRHQWEMTPTTLVTGELHKYKDESLLRDYFFNEYEKDEHPRTYLLAANAEEFYTLSLLTEKRMNRFDETVERLPEAKLDMNNKRLGKSNFYYTGNFSAVNFNKVYPRHTDETPGTITDPDHNNRYDGYNQISYTTKFSFLSLSPYVGMRQTYFERGASDREFGDRSHIRGLFYSGCDISTKFYKVFPVEGAPLGIELNKLRHIITPTLSYNYIHPPTLERGKIFEFDEIDSIDRKNTITLGLENKLQTKKGTGGSEVDLAMLLIETEYDFRHNPGTQFLDYTAKLELKPYDWLTATSNAVIDSHKRYHHEWLKQIDNDIYVGQGEKWSLGAGHRYVSGSNNLVLQGKLGMIPGWRFSAYQDFDILGSRRGEKKKRDLKEQEYVITKELHCWEMDIRYNVDRDEGEEVMVVFRLKAFPEVPFEFGRSYHRPKIGSQG